MGITKKTPHSKDVVGETQSAFGYIRRQVWTDPILADVDRLLADNVSSSSVVTTVTSFLAQPDHPRNITITPTGTTTDVAAGNYVITGTNIRGEVITDTIVIAANASTLQSGTKAFDTVTSFLIPIQDGAAATFDLGVGDVLGLDRAMSGNEVIMATADGVYETTRPTVTFSSTAVESNTIDIDTSLDGSVDVVAVFVSTEKTGKIGSTT